VIIGLSGYAQSGKDSVADILQTSRDFKRLAFADKLKDLYYASNASVRPYVDTDGWEAAKRVPEHREGLQDLGKGVRDILGEDTWVNVVMKQVRDKRSSQDFVIADVRFPNEAWAILDNGGELWRVERPGIEAANGHISEHALDRWDFQVTIYNDGTLLDLADQVFALVG
jgi:hypothetical protein